MNIFIVLYGISLSGGGGAERRFLRVFEKAKQMNNKSIRIIINRKLFESAKSLNLIVDDSQVIIYEDESSNNDLRFSKFVINVLKQHPGCIVHLVLLQRSQILLHLFLLFRRRRFNISVVTTIASYFYAYNLNLKFTEKMNYKLIIGATDVFDSLYSKIKLNRNNVNITPCSFTDYNKYSPSDKEKIVVFSGRLIKDKNPFLFVSAVNELVHKYCDKNSKEWKYFIMGSGPLENELKKYVNDNKLSDFIFFRTGDTSKILKKSKIFVSLQQHENYPSQSLIEAIATKNIIIATDVGDTRKIVKEQYSKLISIDRDSLVEALLDLFEKEEKMNKVAELALIELKATHNIEKFYDYLNTIWAQALRKEYKSKT